MDDRSHVLARRIHRVEVSHVRSHRLVVAFGADRPTVEKPEPEWSTSRATACPTTPAAPVTRMRTLHAGHRDVG